MRWHEYRAFLSAWCIFAAGTLATLAWALSTALRPLGRFP